MSPQAPVVGSWTLLPFNFLFSVEISIVDICIHWLSWVLSGPSLQSLWVSKATTSVTKGFQQSHVKVTAAMLLEETLQNLNLISLRFIFYISYFIVKMHVNTSIPLKLAVEELARLDLERIKDGPGIYPGIHLSMHSFIHSMRHCDLQSSLFLVMVALEWLIFWTWLRNEELWDTI